MTKPGDPDQLTTVPPPAVEGTTERRSRHRDLVSRVKVLWQRGQPPDAITFLRDHASIRANRALALELAYEEFCLRRDQGEQLDKAAFCRRFPSISRSLHRQLEVDAYLQQHPSVIGRPVDIAWPRRGDQLFEFVVVEEIGRGAFGRAYLCAQPGIGNRQVVVKVAPGGAIEADTMGGLDHPNIMSVYSVQVDVESQRSGICMPFVGRSTLFDVIDVAFGQGSRPARAAVILEASRALVRRGDRYHQITPRVTLRAGSPYLTGVLQVMRQIAEALQHAHERGILHGDLKPSNIVMSVRGMPLLVDFNLSQNSHSNNLVTGGTLPYMAPEQIRAMLLGADDYDRVDERSDVFSWGVILFELVTGQLPFPAARTEQEPIAAAGRMLDAQSDGAEGIRQLTRDLDPGLADLLSRCLAFDPQQRPRDMLEVCQQLRRQLARSRRVRSVLRQHRPLVACCTLGLAAVTLSGALWWQQRPPLRDRLYQQGVLAYQRHDFPTAIERLMGAISEDGEFADAYLARGCAELRCYELDHYKGRLDAAYRDFTTAVRYGAGMEAKVMRAYCLLRNERFDLAQAEYRAIIGAGAASPDVLNNLALSCMKLSLADDVTPQTVARFLSDADSFLRAALAQDPNNSFAQLNFSVLELRKFRLTDGSHVPREGLDAIRRLLATDPPDAATCVLGAKLVGAVALIDGGSDALFSEGAEYARRAAMLGHQFDIPNLEHDNTLRYLTETPWIDAISSQVESPRPATVGTRIQLPRLLLHPFRLNHHRAL